jgi:hypothetical protein
MWGCVCDCGFGTKLGFPDLGSKDASFPLLVLLYMWRSVRVVNACRMLASTSSFGMALIMCPYFCDDLCSWLWLCYYVQVAAITFCMCVPFYKTVNHSLVLECVCDFSDCFCFDDPGSMHCPSLIRRRGAAGGVCLITMPADGSLSQMGLPLPPQGCHHRYLVMCSKLSLVSDKQIVDHSKLFSFVRKLATCFGESILKICASTYLWEKLTNKCQASCSHILDNNFYLEFLYGIYVIWTRNDSWQYYDE